MLLTDLLHGNTHSGRGDWRTDAFIVGTGYRF
ncbi:Ail/Lom family outer membrane beta-barrel protein [Escherichia coli]